MLCPRCGNANAVAAKFCASCGSVLPHAVQDAPTPHTEINLLSSSEEFYKAIIGPKNQGYYLSHFSRFDSKRKVSASWHWPAFFVPFYWFLYRKMWLYAIIFALIFVCLVCLLGIAAAISPASGDYPDALTIIFIFSWVGLDLFSAIYANALYYKHCRKVISRAGAPSDDLQSRIKELSTKDGISNMAPLVVAVISILVILVVVTAAVPDYQDYIEHAESKKAIPNDPDHIEHAKPTKAFSVSESHAVIPQEATEALAGNRVSPEFSADRALLARRDSYLKDLKELKPTSYTFNTPSPIKVATPITVYFWMDPLVDPMRLGEELKAKLLEMRPGETPQTEAGLMDWSPKMRATLTGEDFDITPTDTENLDGQKYLSATRRTEWSWDVKAKHVGQQLPMHLRVWAVLPQGLGEPSEVLKLDRLIHVEVTFLWLVDEFWDKYWKWLLGGLGTALAGAIGALWKRRQARGNGV